MTAVIDEARPQRVSFFNDPKVRSRVAQIVFVLLLAWIDIIQTPLTYSRASLYIDAIIIGLLNTLIIAGLGIILATILGFIIGIMRLSSNWVIAKIATGYVELIRNIPLLLQMFFWYAAVLKPLPGPRQGINFFDLAFLSNRGLVIP